MKKIIVIGCAGSGKSYFTSKLSKILKINKYHLDNFYWNENWIATEKELFISKIKDILKNDSYIIDGDYFSSLKIRLDECDTIFFLDIDTDICLSSVRERMGKKRDDLPDYLIETEYEDELFINNIKNYNINKRPLVLKLLEEYKNKNIIVLKSRDEINNYLFELELKRRKI